MTRQLKDPQGFTLAELVMVVALIAVLAAGLGPAWLAILLWLWAPLVALARVAMGVHYLSDILAGALLGFLVGLLGLGVYQPLLDLVAGWFSYPLW